MVLGCWIFVWNKINTNPFITYTQNLASNRSYIKTEIIKKYILKWANISQIRCRKY